MIVSKGIWGPANHVVAENGTCGSQWEADGNK